MEERNYSHANCWQFCFLFWMTHTKFQSLVIWQMGELCLVNSYTQHGLMYYSQMDWDEFWLNCIHRPSRFHVKKSITPVSLSIYHSPQVNWHQLYQKQLIIAWFGQSMGHPLDSGHLAVCPVVLSLSTVLLLHSCLFSLFHLHLWTAVPSSRNCQVNWGSFGWDPE